MALESVEGEQEHTGELKPTGEGYAGRDCTRVSDLGRTLLEVKVGDEGAKRRGRARAELR